MRVPVALLVLTPGLSGLTIQASPASAQDDGWTATRLTGELAFRSFNTLIGGLTARIRAGFAEGPLGPGGRPGPFRSR
jgi:hypothetical protein